MQLFFTGRTLIMKRLHFASGSPSSKMNYAIAVTVLFVTLNFSYGYDRGSHLAAVIKRETLPLATQYAHPSDVCVMRDGKLGVIYNGGPAEGASVNKVWFTRQRNDGSWTVPVMVEKNPETKPLDVGVIYQPRNKSNAPLLVYFFWNGNPTQATFSNHLSTDNGVSWGQRYLNPAEPSGAPWDEYNNPNLPGATQNAPVELSDGSLIVAGSLEKKTRDGRAPIIKIPANNYSGNEPGGDPWEVLSIAPSDFSSGERCYLPGFLILSSDRTRLAIVGRTGMNTNHSIAVSNDQGRSWGSTSMMSNAAGGAGVGCVSLDVDGGAAQGYHIVAGSGADGSGRNGLAVGLCGPNKDVTNSSNWSRAFSFHIDEGGEDADPTIVQGDDRKVHIVFTGRGAYVGINHYVIDPDALINPPGSFAGVLQYKKDDWSVNESGGRASLTLMRTGGASGAVSVNYATVDRWAEAGSDYTASTGTVSWGAGDSQDKTISIDISNDSDKEGNEDFLVMLSSPTGGARVLGNEAAVTIVDDETNSVGVLNFKSVGLYKQSEGIPGIRLAVTGHKTKGFTCDYEIASGSAILGEDFTASKTSGTLNWRGADDQTIEGISLIDDNIDEGDETFTVILKNPTGGAELGSHSVLTFVIQDNDGGATIQSSPVENVSGVLPAMTSGFADGALHLILNTKGGPAKLQLIRPNGSVAVTLVNRNLAAGRHSVTVPAFLASTGMLIARYQQGTVHETQKIIVIK
ncbi:MAG: hypothetical protein GF398_05970 [Chitinivibrionales bacterium]|nr:hypothetical protein [Chitinivibrionales bacterium]